MGGHRKKGKGRGGSHAAGEERVGKGTERIQDLVKRATGFIDGLVSSPQLEKRRRRTKRGSCQVLQLVMTAELMTGVSKDRAAG